MTYVITEPCLGARNRACVDVCPVDCIHDGGDMFLIDPEECIDCAACVPACPVTAIFVEADVPSRWKHYVDLNRNFFGTKDAGSMKSPVNGA